MTSISFLTLTGQKINQSPIFFITDKVYYLHESASPIHGMPTYPQDPDSFPYAIVISDPRLPLSELGVRAYGFHINDLIPVLEIPLLGNDTVSIGFNEAYQFTFRVGKWAAQIDYAELPERIETYSELDQQRIRERMATFPS